MEQDIYQRLAKHLAALGMGYPDKEELLEILQETFSLVEAEVALAIPTKVIPFRLVSLPQIAARLVIPKEQVASVLDMLAQRGLIASGRMENGEKGYCLQQFGYGFPQTYFWSGADTPFSRKMAKLVMKYVKKTDLIDAYGKTSTKPFRYVPAQASFDPASHAVFPFEMMATLIEKVSTIALAHCPCRMTTLLLDKKQCSHPTEVCIKYDDLAEYLIENGMGREITKKEALATIRSCEEAGLVHLVDNARTGIKHTCNCCGCCCWSVGSIKRRAIPRDVLMATYFVRDTDRENCSGCGMCVEICPVGAVRMEGELPVIDGEWCIGCGVCAVPCPSSAVILSRRSDAVPPADFRTLHETIIREKGV
jgi:NAD-dependent dihydropyrimidine dehydrogenase PreA subunit